MNDLTININTHDFELAKEHIREFSETMPLDVELKNFKTDGGLFDLFDHKVTGEEMNALVSQLQELHINQNFTNMELIEEFSQVYQALEALDSDYIQGILAAIKASEKTQDDLKREQKELQKTQKDLNTTIDFLVDTNAAVSDIRRDTNFGVKHVATYNQKLKRAYILAGGAVVLTILQFVLNIMGII